MSDTERDYCPCLLKRGQSCLRVSPFSNLVYQRSGRVFPTKEMAESSASTLSEDNLWNLNPEPRITLKLRPVRSEDIKFRGSKCDFSCEYVQHMKKTCPVSWKSPKERNKTIGLHILGSFPKEMPFIHKSWTASLVSLRKMYSIASVASFPLSLKKIHLHFNNSNKSHCSLAIY